MSCLRWGQVKWQTEMQHANHIFHYMQKLLWKFGGKVGKIAMQLIPPVTISKIFFGIFVRSFGFATQIAMCLKSEWNFLKKTFKSREEDTAVDSGSVSMGVNLTRNKIRWLRWDSVRNVMGFNTDICICFIIFELKAVICWNSINFCLCLHLTDSFWEGVAGQRLPDPLWDWILSHLLCSFSFNSFSAVVRHSSQDLHCHCRLCSTMCLWHCSK